MTPLLGLGAWIAAALGGVAVRARRWRRSRAQLRKLAVVVLLLAVAVSPAVTHRYGWTWDGRHK